MNENFVVTVGGLHGSGRTTLAKAVAKKYGLDRFSTGEVFRRIAKEKGFELPLFNEVASKEVDLEIDKQNLEAGEKGGVVIESDMAAWINRSVPGKTVLRIWLDASAETRGTRIFNDEKKRESEGYENVGESIKKVAERDNADRSRYVRVYNVDIYPNTYEAISAEVNRPEYDKIVNTDNLTIEQVAQKVFEFLDGKGMGIIQAKQI